MEVVLHPDTVMMEFGDVECCAMQRASIQEVHQPFIQEYLAGVAKTHMGYNTSILLGIFQRTPRLVFIVTDVHRALYAQLAAREKATFEKSEDQILECDHLATQHWRALDAIWVKMQPRQELYYQHKET